MEALRRILGRRPARSPTPFLRAYLVGMVLVVLFLDFAAGPEIRFPILYTIPVVLSAWFGFPILSLLAIVILAPIRSVLELSIWSLETDPSLVALNGLIRLVVLAALAFLVYQAGVAVRRIGVLEGILPICSYCKRIRDERNAWHPLDSYLSARSNAAFSHGLCPACMQREYGAYFDPPAPPPRDPV